MVRKSRITRVPNDLINFADHIVRAFEPYKLKRSDVLSGLVDSAKTGKLEIDLKNMEKKRVGFKNRGTLLNMIVGPVVLVALVITVIIAGFLLNEITIANNSSSAATNFSKDVLEDYNTNFANRFDNLLAFIFFGLMLSIAIFGYYFRLPAVFYIALFFLLAISVYLWAVYANVYDDFTSTGALASEATNYGLMNFIFTNLPMLLLGLGALVGILLLLRRGQS